MSIPLIRLAVAATTAAALLLSGCATESDSTENPNSAAADAATGEWPRTFDHEAGSVTLESQPMRIVSTSPSITGSLLAIDAPVIATGTPPKTMLTDDNGFFVQWADVAVERGVEVAYSNFDVDLDAIDALEPDLIIGSSSGGDATIDEFDQLSDIAPTVMLNYGQPSWQDLTTMLGELTGREEEATAVIDEFASWVGEQSGRVAPPAKPVTVMSYLGAEGAWVLDQDSAQAQLLQELGFTYADLPERLGDGGPNGVTVVTQENIPDVLADSGAVFLLPSGGPVAVKDFTGNPLFAGIPAVKEDQVYSLGDHSFRLDYYSAKLTVSHIVDLFAR